MAERTTEDQLVYGQQFYRDVLDAAEVEGGDSFLEEALTGLVLDTLEEEGLWPDYVIAHYERRGLGLSAWGIESTQRKLYLAITDFSNDDEVKRLGLGDRDARYKRLINFFGKCRDGGINIDEVNPISDLAEIIAEGDRFEDVHLTLVTNRISGGEEHPPQDLDGRTLTFGTCDLETIRRARESGLELEPIDIDFVKRFGSGIPYLQATTTLPGVETYLLFLPGQHLADLYHEFGARLLERNVRAFLMARTKVNRGIRDTLRDAPERFLSYNNGLTATASGVEFCQIEGVRHLRRVKDLQIVNGGQTTASITAAARDPEVEIDDVQVQVKLAVVDAEVIDELVPNISRYANAQNTVQASDLSANHPYLRALERISRAEWTPASSGRQTRWYFERQKGAYNVEKARQESAADRKRWSRDQPVSQKFGKSELALYQNTWDRLPHLVCRGSQKNFTEFMLHLDEEDGFGGGTYQKEFRRLVAKAIVFKTADKLVRDKLGGTYKRPVVAYTVAYYLHKIDEMPDLKAIWRSQQVDPEICDSLLMVAEPLKEELISAAAGLNVTEYAKKEECWKHLKSRDFRLRPPSPLVRSSGSTPPPKTPPGGPSGTASSVGKSSGAARTVKRLPREGGMTLYECTKAVFGEPVAEDWRRFKKPVWRYLGNTKIQSSGGRHLHAFVGEWVQNDGTARSDLIVVEEGSTRATSSERLGQHLQHQVEAWFKEERRR